MMEMIIVVAVIGLLVGIVLPNISSVRERSENEKLVAELGLIEQALYKYKEVCGMYPIDTTTGKLNIAANSMPNSGVCSSTLKNFLPASMQTSLPTELQYFGLKRSGVQSSRCTSFFLAIPVKGGAQSTAIKRMEARGWKWSDAKSGYAHCSGIKPVSEIGVASDLYYVISPTPF